MEKIFCAEVLKSAASLKRADANEIVKTLIPKYEGKLKSPIKGKSFVECYDVKTLTLIREWQEIYDGV